MKNMTFENIKKALEATNREELNGDASGAFHYFIGYLFECLEHDKVVDQYERAALEVGFNELRQRFYKSRHRSRRNA